MLLIPYRVKNPPKRFPVVTVTLIVINVIVYLLTSDSNFLSIREDVARNYSAGGLKLPFINYFTGMFLHGDPFHIIGNMLMLWVFGPAVEDRLGPAKFLTVYFSAGLAGDLLQSAVHLLVANYVVPSIGASGCILGVLGAYWYLFPWSTVCIAYWVLIIYYGVIEVAAIWVIGIYVGLNLLEGLISADAAGGVAYFCHVGGAVAGVLLCFLIKAERDPAEVSEAREIQADVKDLNNMPVHSLLTMLEHDPLNASLIRALVNQAIKLHYPEAVDQAMSRAGHMLIDKDPALVAYYLTTFHGNPHQYHPVSLMRLSGLLERGGNPQMAIQVYQVLCHNYPDAPDVETALYRMAQCYWTFFHDSENAVRCIRELGGRFPNGPMAPFARSLMSQMGRS